MLTEQVEKLEPSPDLMLTEQVGRLEPDLESRLEPDLELTRKLCRQGPDLGLMLIGQKLYFERVLS